jgi:hypothetical protein
MAGPQQPNSNPLGSTLDVLTRGLPLIFGDKETTDTTTGPLDLADTQSLQNYFFQRGTSTAQTDKVVEDILYRAQLAFAPVLGEEKNAGMYNTQTRNLLAKEALARATAASATAVLDDQQKALAQATSLQNTTTQAKAAAAPKTTEKKKESQGKNLLKGLGITFAGNRVIRGGDKLIDEALAEIDTIGTGPSAEAIETNRVLGDEFTSGLDEALQEPAIVPSTALQDLQDFDFSVLTQPGQAALLETPAVEIETLLAETTPAETKTAFVEDSPPIEEDVPDLEFEDTSFLEEDYGFLEDLGDFSDLAFEHGGHVAEKVRAGYTQESLAAQKTLRPRPNIVEKPSSVLNSVLNVSAVDAVLNSVAPPSPKITAASTAVPKTTTPKRKEPTISSTLEQDGGSDTDVDRSTPEASPGAKKALADMHQNPISIALASFALAMGQPAVAANVLARSYTIGALRDFIRKTPAIPIDPFTGLPNAMPQALVDPKNLLGEEQEPEEESEALLAQMRASLADLEATVGPETEETRANLLASMADFKDAPPPTGMPAAQEEPPGAVAEEQGRGPDSTDDPGPGSTAPSSGEGPGEGGSDTGSDYAGGGIVVGSEKLDVNNIDGIPIVVQPDEYVIPEDVVEILGVDFFDKMLDAFHTSGPKRKGARNAAR